MRRSASILVTLVAIVVGAIFVIPKVQPGNDEVAAQTDSDVSSTKTETVQVNKQNLEEKTTANGNVGHGKTRVLPIAANGVVTEAPEEGALVNPGDIIIRINDRPITLVAGEQPLYRELRRVGSGERDEAGNRVGVQKGPDVEQLQRFLLSEGFTDKDRLEVDGEFGLSTERAVKAWQAEVGHVATGKVDRSQVIFTIGQLRIDKAPSVGDDFTEVVVTGTTPTVSATVTDRQKSFFAIGSTVEVESTKGSTTGTVRSSERTIGDDGSDRHRIEIDLDAGGELGEVEVAKVTATKLISEEVLTVPVRALIALAEGGWAVQVDAADGVALKSVELGVVVDGLAEITGLEEGTEVVVPS